ncbi:dipeptidase 1 isoform X1 [Lagenorhynchus albirostris]|uniref:dipeptidase 1 isoform X1 n=1 Tax=Lagenorhynchus albirostris TaxID=27610 RepID=UPI0028E6EA91|nr:dipeptidase 1 isoform X1 [Lagenorhynchus albirostris]
MWASWWFWPLVAVCTADQFRNTAERIMQGTPVIDGHNDLPWQLLKLFNNQLQDPRANLTSLAHTHTNIPKLRAGFVGAQFWSAYTPCDTQNKDAVKRTLEQVDVIHRMYQLCPEAFVPHTRHPGTRVARCPLPRPGSPCRHPAGLPGGKGGQSGRRGGRPLHRQQPGRPAGALPPGHAVPDSHPQLQHALGRQLAGGHGRGRGPQPRPVTLWAECREGDEPTGHHHRPGPRVHGHHEGCAAAVQGPRGLQPLLGLQCVPAPAQRARRRAPAGDHLDHIKKVAGAGAVGLGGDYDGVSRLPSGLEDVSKYPDLAAELLRRQWTEAEVKGVLADNLLRVFEAVEQARSHTQAPGEEPIPLGQLEASCRTSYGYSGAPSLHLQPGALLASLALLVLCPCRL